MKAITVVIIDDERFYLDWISQSLGDDFHVYGALSLAEGLALVRQHQPEALLLDITLEEGIEGLAALPQIRREFPDLPVVIVSNHDRLSYYRQSGDEGALAYFIKSEPVEQLREVIEQLALAAPNISNPDLPIAKSVAMRRILKLAKQFAKTDETVLITGETGVGKDLLAGYLHTHSGRMNGPFVPVNCTAIEPNLIIAELFGHVKGAFTGAEKDRKGYFQAADGGTIFLDEIGDMPLHDQARLLRVIETRQVTPVGAAHPLQLDVRIIAATNAPLDEKRREGTFREDLFYRLNQFTLHIPPLREREADIIPLARFFLQQIAAEHRTTPKTLTHSALLTLKNHAWSGNVRELQNTVRRAHVTAPGREISGSHLQLLDAGSPEPEVFKTARKQFERDFLKAALASHHGNTTAAAKAVGLSRQGLQKKMQELGLDLNEDELN